MRTNDPHNEAENASDTHRREGRPSVAGLLTRSLARFDNHLLQLEANEQVAKASDPDDPIRLLVRAETLLRDDQVDGLRFAVGWMKRRKGVELPTTRHERRGIR